MFILLLIKSSMNHISSLNVFPFTWCQDVNNMTFNCCKLVEVLQCEIANLIPKCSFGLRFEKYCGKGNVVKNLCSWNPSGTIHLVWQCCLLKDATVIVEDHWWIYLIFDNVEIYLNVIEYQVNPIMPTIFYSVVCDKWSST